jgi:phosphoserine phosphatase RsbU/P
MESNRADQIVMRAKDDHFSILVVDDDESNRDSLRRRLERRGYLLTVASGGPEAIERVAEGRFDLIILDVMMPGMSGLEVLDRLRQANDSTTLPIIMATAQNESADIVYALEHGANDYVTKPLDFAVVQARVHTQLQLKRSVDQIRLLERDLILRNAELERANALLKKSAARTVFELEAASRVQQAFLPAVDIRMPGVQFSWVFEPCTELAGDALNVIRLDENHSAFYVVDVSGHGVAASLLAVAAVRMLSLTGSDDSMLLTKIPDGAVFPARPADIASRLSAAFSSHFESGQFLTLFYAVLNLRTRELTYVSAGHPSAILIDAAGRATELAGSGAVIGLGEAYDQQVVRLNDGERLYVYSDGVIECLNEQNAFFGIERFVLSIAMGRHVQLNRSLISIQESLAAWRGCTPPHDDISIVGVECVIEPCADDRN